MKEETINALDAALEGLINFIASEKPDQAARDKALRGLIELRQQLEQEVA